MISPILILIAGLLVLVYLGTLPKGRLLQSITLLVLFMFAIPNLNATQGMFYSIMAVSVLIFSILGLHKDLDKKQQKNKKFKGMFLQMGIGIAFIGVMFLFQNRAGGQILGVPGALGIATTMSPLLISSLGYLENNFFFGLINLIQERIFPFIALPFIVMFSFILPIIVVAGLFAMFHLTAYSLSLGLMGFAFLIFILWGALAEFGYSEAANIAHYLWNGIVTVGMFTAI